MKPSENKGILYPNDCSLKVKAQNKEKLESPLFRTVPHGSWKIVKEQLDRVFEEVKNKDPKTIFVLSPLHKGKISPEDKFCCYSYEDCFVNDPFIEKDNEVCSEEFSYEILIPYFDSYFPNSTTTAFFGTIPATAEEEKEIKSFLERLKTNYPNSIFLFSDNSGCCRMWTKAKL